MKREPRMTESSRDGLSVVDGKVVRPIFLIDDLDFDDFNIDEDDAEALEFFSNAGTGVMHSVSERLESLLKVRTLPFNYYNKFSPEGDLENNIDIFMADNPEDFKDYLSFMSSQIDGYHMVMFETTLPSECLSERYIPGERLEELATEIGDQLVKLQTPTMKALLRSVSIVKQDGELRLVLSLFVKF